MMNDYYCPSCEQEFLNVDFYTCPICGHILELDEDPFPDQFDLPEDV